MPAITRPRAMPTQPSCDRGTELQYPAPHRFVGNVEPSVRQQFLDIAVAQGEAEIKPDRVLDDLGREAMAAVAERRHVDVLPDTPSAPDPVSVTMPVLPLSDASRDCRLLTIPVKELLEAAMWWSRESLERRKEALAQRPHIKEA